MEKKSVARHSKSNNIQDYFRRVQQQGFERSSPRASSNMPPCHVETHWNMDVSGFKKLQQQKVNNKRKRQQSASLLGDKPSELTGMIVESSNSSDDSVQVNGTTVESNFDRTITEAGTTPKHGAEEKMFASIFTKKEHLESEWTQIGLDKQHLQTKSNALGLPIKQGFELEVTESNSDNVNYPLWREEFSGPVQKRCLVEIQESNPVFPVQRIFAALRKKYKEHSKVLIYPALSNPPSMLNPAGAKRKRHQNERGDSEKLPKRWRYNLEEMAQREAITLASGSPSESARGSSVVLPTRGQPGKCRLSRTHRLRQQEERLCLGQSDEPKPDQPHQPDSVGATLSCHRRDKHIEDLLWTDKYCPQNSSEVIGNSASVKKLHSWLRRWKLRADCEERRKELEKRQQDDSNDSWDCGDFQGEACVEEEGEELSTTMLITGPPGVGKTASVYACALELGFKVFEVNASCQRNGRHVLTQLKEATQSHLVDIQGQALLKPTYLRNSSSTKPDTFSGTETSSRKLVSSSRKFPRQNSCSTRLKGKGNQASITLANFFKMKSKAESIAVDGLSSKNTDIHTSLNYPSPDNEEPATGGQNKMTTTSLILFEEVDIIFDDDLGFLSAIKTFMSTTKRPVILTTDDPSFRAIFNANFEAVLFKTPSTVNTCSYLRLLCLAENIRTEPGDITSLLEVTRGDIRRSVLQVQLWGSSREKRSPRTEVPETSNGSVMVDPKSKDSRPLCGLPCCELGCTPSMLGLLNAGVGQELVNFQKSWMEPEVLKLMEVLRESWRRGVPLLYSNLELLSLSPAQTQPASLSIPEEVPQTGPRNHPRPADIHPQTPGLSCTAPTRTSSRLSRRKRARVSDPGSIHSVSPHRTSSSLNIHSRTSSTNDKPTTLNQAQRVESQSLGAIADFMDLMSHLDSTLPTPDLHTAGPCGSGEFIWTGARVKDGLLDEMREEEHGSCSLERALEIQAALEALAYHTCRTVVSGVWGRGQDLGEEFKDEVTEELTSPVAPHRQISSFTHTSILEPSVSQRRYNINKTVVSSRAFSTIGNKQAFAVDYLPVLRTICQSQRSQEQAGGRFQHYFSRIQLGLSKSTFQLLAEDFP